MKNWKAIAGICLVFVLGGGAGSLITTHFIAKRIRYVLQASPQVANEIIVNRLMHKLGLNTDQREKLKTIVADTRTEIQSERRQIAPQVKATLADSIKKIRAMLTPDQDKKFDEVIERNKARLTRFD